MYPLCKWKNIGVVKRLRTLIDNEFYYEAVVVSTQILEQLIKRIIISKLIEIKKKIGETNLITAYSKNDVEHSVMRHCQSIQEMKKIWSLMEKENYFTIKLDEIFNKYCNPTAWMNIVSQKFQMNEYVQADISKEFEFPNINNKVGKFGLIKTRNDIVHGINAHMLEDTRVLSYFGYVVVKKLIMSNVFKEHRIRDPFKRISNWQHY
jgi:hypothetical protein